MPRPLVLLTTTPAATAMLFPAATRRELDERFDVVEVTDQDPRFDELLPEAFAVVGQPDLPTARLLAATELRVLCNVEGNFFPNVDYAACFARGVHVLGGGPAYAQPVAEMALGLALDLARGITRADREFRAGRERYNEAGTAGSVLLRHADVGLVGLGAVGRALLPLLRPFAARLRGYDPWLPPRAVAELGVEPVDLDALVSASAFVFVLAASTVENAGLLDARRVALLQPGARFVLLGRAATVDLDALCARVERGEVHAAVDVWPQEPVPADDPVRGLDGMVLSSHRAGALPDAFRLMGEMVVDDLAQVAGGLPPVRMQVASRELVGRYRSLPVVR